MSFEMGLVALTLKPKEIARLPAMLLAAHVSQF